MFMTGQCCFWGDFKALFHPWFWNMRLVWFVLMPLFCFQGVLKGQARELPHPPFSFPISLPEFDTVLGLSGAWLSEDDKLQYVPFQLNTERVRTFRRLFRVQEFGSRSDTMFIRFEGVAWKAEIRLNGRLLKVSEDPFRDFILPVPLEWLKPVDNELIVKMFPSGQSHESKAAFFSGIFRPVWLLERSSRGVTTDARGSFQNGGPREILIFPAWNPETGFLDPDDHYRSIPDSFAQAGVSHLLFPLALSMPVRRVFAHGPKRFSLSNLPLKSGTLFALWQAYPIQRGLRSLNEFAWHDLSGKRTDFYGKYAEFRYSSSNIVETPDQLALAMLLAGIVLFLLLFKLFNSRIYGVLFEFISKPKIYLELIANGKFLRPIEAFALTLFRLFALATTATLFFYFLQLSNQTNFLNIFSSNSLLHQFLKGGDQEFGILFLMVLGFVVGLSLLKYLLISVLERVYKLPSFAGYIPSLDFFASFPANLFAIIPLSLLFFSDGDYQVAILVVFIVLLMSSLSRRLITLYWSLSNLMSFSRSMKILYICGLEILPWVFLL